MYISKRRTTGKGLPSVIPEMSSSFINLGYEEGMRSVNRVRRILQRRADTYAFNPAGIVGTLVANMDFSSYERLVQSIKTIAVHAQLAAKFCDYIVDYDERRTILPGNDFQTFLESKLTTEMALYRTVNNVTINYALISTMLTTPFTSINEGVVVESRQAVGNHVYALNTLYDNLFDNVDANNAINTLASIKVLDCIQLLLRKPSLLHSHELFNKSIESAEPKVRRKRKGQSFTRLSALLTDLLYIPRLYEAYSLVVAYEELSAMTPSVPKIYFDGYEEVTKRIGEFDKYGIYEDLKSFKGVFVDASKDDSKVQVQLFNANELNLFNLTRLRGAITDNGNWINVPQPPQFPTNAENWYFSDLNFLDNDNLVPYLYGLPFLQRGNGPSAWLEDYASVLHFRLGVTNSLNGILTHLETLKTNNLLVGASEFTEKVWKIKYLPNFVPRKIRFNPNEWAYTGYASNALSFDELRLDYSIGRLEDIRTTKKFKMFIDVNYYTALNSQGSTSTDLSSGGYYGVDYDLNDEFLQLWRMPLGTTFLNPCNIEESLCQGDKIDVLSNYSTMFSRKQLNFEIVNMLSRLLGRNAEDVRRLCTNNLFLTLAGRLVGGVGSFIKLQNPLPDLSSESATNWSEPHANVITDAIIDTIRASIAANNGSAQQFGGDAGIFGLTDSQRLRYYLSQLNTNTGQNLTEMDAMLARPLLIEVIPGQVFFAFNRWIPFVSAEQTDVSVVLDDGFNTVRTYQVSSNLVRYFEGNENIYLHLHESRRDRLAMMMRWFTLNDNKAYAYALMPSIDKIIKPNAFHERANYNVLGFYTRHKVYENVDLYGSIEAGNERIAVKSPFVRLQFTGYSPLGSRIYGLPDAFNEDLSLGTATWEDSSNKSTDKVTSAKSELAALEQRISNEAADLRNLSNEQAAKIQSEQSNALDTLSTDMNKMNLKRIDDSSSAQELNASIMKGKGESKSRKKSRKGKDDSKE